MAHGVTLLDAQEAFLQRSGAKRVRLIAASAANVGPLLEAGAAPKLLSLLERTADGGKLARLETVVAWRPSGFSRWACSRCQESGVRRLRSVTQLPSLLRPQPLPSRSSRCRNNGSSGTLRWSSRRFLRSKFGHHAKDPQ